MAVMGGVVINYYDRMNGYSLNNLNVVHSSYNLVHNDMALPSFIEAVNSLFP